MKTIVKLAGAVAFSVALLQGAAQAQDQSIQIPKQKVDEALRAKLPEAIRSAGKMISVNNGSFPPYEIVTDTNKMIGASADLSDALGELLGVKIEHATVNGLASSLSGIAAGRFQFAMGPIGDFKSRQEQNDFVDYVREFVIFAVQKGNPKAINSLEDSCGKKIAVMSAGSAEKVIKAQAEKCAAEGKPTLEVMSFTDQPTSILSVRSRRADAFFSSQAPLTYFVQQAKGDLELAAIGKANGFQDLFQGAVVPKGSPLGPVLLDGIKALKANGTYAAIFKKWGLDNNMIDEPGINRSTN
ncbi:ABC transporter substrate-binding protein [Hyphomicrobiales bacterium]|nr:ABC transporter substrate-binding protein [Hyphomicrobiales bacterium]CAH1698642.1 ABC transporter substrate-binding protein [Hyphomicrobiales bacterium]CAI0342287.1 ABC transporter substrate-binding protein [Hyphomicrobiales bacterium]